jgi:hypothetical protein
LLAAVVGCSNSDVSGHAENPMTVPLNWSPEQVSYRCSDERFCPDNQGVLLSVKQKSFNYGYFTQVRLSFTRCTATLFEASKVVTAGHCLDGMKDADRIWFKTVSRQGQPSRTVTVNKALAMGFSEGDSLMADYGSFQLSEPLDGVTYGHPASHPPRGTEMLALVANMRDDDNFALTLDAVRCKLGDGLSLPLPLDKNPSKFMIEDCVIHSGNSGGSVVQADDLTAIFGIVSTATNPEVIKEKQRQTEQIIPVPDFKALNEPNWAGITNARCLNMPGWTATVSPCTQMSLQASQQFSADAITQKGQKLAVNQLGRWRQDVRLSQVQGEGYSIHFTPEPATYVKKAQDIFGTAVLPIPACVAGSLPESGVETTIPISVERYKKDFQEYVVAEPIDSHAFIHLSLLPGKTDNRYHIAYQIVEDENPSANSIQPAVGGTAKILLISEDAKIPECTAADTAALPTRLSD